MTHVTQLMGGYTYHATEINANGAWVLVCRPSVCAPTLLYGGEDGIPEANCKNCLRRLTRRG